MNSADLAAVWLTLKLATVVTFLLLLVGTPIAWWLARTRSRLKGGGGAVGDEIRAKTAPLEQKWLASAKAKGIANPEQVLNDFRTEAAKGRP